MAQDMEQLYRRHYQTVYSYALRLTGSEHAAEELAAETFYRAMVALPDFRGECAASTWLCQIARNTWTSLRRKEGRCQPLDDTAALPDSRDFAAAFEDKDLALRIHRLLHRLPENQRRAILRALRLAQELGAETATLADPSEERAVLRYAREHNLGKIVIGRQSKRRWWDRSGFADRLARHAPDLDLVVIALDEKAASLPARFIIQACTSASIQPEACFPSLIWAGKSPSLISL